VDIRRKRLKILVDVWGQLLDNKKISSREDIISILKREYEKNGTEPFRGVAKPQDLYEKDLITLYLVGVYGLGIADEARDIIDKFLEPEKLYEKASEILINTNDPEATRKEIISLFNRTPDSSILSKIFRVEILKHYFGFVTEDRMSRLLINMLKAFPEEEATVRRLSKFYIAYKVGLAILNNEIRDWTTKEIYKQAIAVELKGIKGIPDDDYIAKILSSIFGVKKEKYMNILRMSIREA